MKNVHTVPFTISQFDIIMFIFVQRLRGIFAKSSVSNNKYYLMRSSLKNHEVVPVDISHVFPGFP